MKASGSSSYGLSAHGGTRKAAHGSRRRHGFAVAQHYTYYGSGTITYNASELPAGLKFDSSTGASSGTAVEEGCTIAQVPLFIMA